MADEPNTPARAQGGAAKRPEIGEREQGEAGETGAGQEARRGVPPGDHDHEHQSNYGGGGANGGVNGDEGRANSDER